MENIKSFFNAAIASQKMNPLNSMVPLVLFLAVAFTLLSPAKPDAAVIKNLCGKTEQPEICSECLNSDAGSQTADGRGLALIAIGCAERNARLMAQRLGSLVHATPQSPLKNILNDCWMSVGFAAGNFPGMKSAIADGDYAGGRNDLEITIRNVNSCLAEFNQNPTIPVPSDILAGTVAVDQGCRVISDILNNI